MALLLKVNCIMTSYFNRGTIISDMQMVISDAF